MKLLFPSRFIIRLLLMALLSGAPGALLASDDTTVNLRWTTSANSEVRGSKQISGKAQVLTTVGSLESKRSVNKKGVRIVIAPLRIVQHLSSRAFAKKWESYE